MSSLIWKEWHEQRWKLGFGCLVLGSLTFIGLRARLVADENMVMWVCFLGMSLLPVLASTGLLPAERSEGSFESLLAFPIAPWRILLAKTLMGLLLCAGPMIVAAALSVAVAADREITRGEMISLYARSLGTTLSLFAWMLALTSRLPTEARAAMLALGLLVLWLLATAGLARPGVPPLAFSVSPLGFVYGFAAGSEPAAWAEVLVMQAVIAAALWAWTTRRLAGAVEGAS
jgi:hypothetical protein